MTTPQVSSAAARAWQSYWGKSARDPSKHPRFHRLAGHSLDVAAVADCWMTMRPAWLSFWAGRFGVSPDTLCRWVTFWIALHDLGKFADPFQMLRPDVVAALGRSPVAQRAMGDGVRHDTFGLWAWRSLQPADLLGPTRPIDADRRDALVPWVSAVVGHHGRAPIAWSARSQADSDLAFPAEAQRAVRDFVHDVRGWLLPDEVASEWWAMDPEHLLAVSTTFSWWLAGLAVLADWIGSNTNWFPYDDHPVADGPAYLDTARARAMRALSSAGVVPPHVSAALRMQELLPSIVTPSPLQRWACQVELGDEARIILVEDVPGAGKTEAAAILVHRMLAQGAADGFYIALPTMATANAMYGRIAGMLARLYPGLPSLSLSHGRASLLDAYTSTWVEDLHETGLRSGPADDHLPSELDSASIHCARWLTDNHKRALLAPAGVGTIDQALVGALRVRHQSLRLIGLARKVLVVDEVHACDPFVARLLQVLLELHASAGGSAILMSATLPAAMKRDLLRAYARGRRLALDPQYEGAERIPCASIGKAGSALAVEAARLGCRPDVARRVTVRHVSDRNEVLRSLLSEAGRGGCAAWICNTIHDALRARADLLEIDPAARVLLFHSRFALRDRLDIEAELLRRFGPEATGSDRSGWIVVATQVAEQSLDLDFDHLVTDLAPIDRLIQRAGRLRRHRRTAGGDRQASADASDERGPPCLWIHGPAFVEDPPKDWVSRTMRGTSFVYPDHAALWLSCRALQGAHFDMPNDARGLVEAVFGLDAAAPAGLQRQSIEAAGKASADRSMADAKSVAPDLGYADLGRDTWDDEMRAVTRLGEASCDVLLARWEQGRLLPWRSDVSKHPWPNSGLRVAARLIAPSEADDGATADSTGPEPELDAALAALRATEPAVHSRATVLVLRRSEDGGWRTRAPDGRRRVREWTYSRQDGLMEPIPTSAGNI